MFRRAGLAALCRAGSTLLPAAPAGPATLRCAAGNGLPAASPPWITDVMGVGCLSQRARRSPEFELGWARRFSDAAGGAGEGPGDGPAAATAAAATQQTQTPTPLDFGDEPKIVLYRGKGILVFRLLVRAKVAQMGGVAATALLLQTLLRSPDATALHTAVASALLVGATTASAALWYFSRRYVGELALLPPVDAGGPPRVMLSVMDFWGNRQDDVWDLQRVAPVPALRSAAAQPLVTLEIEGGRQYYLSLRFGALRRPDLLRDLLTGELQARLRARPDGSWGWR